MKRYIIIGVLIALQSTLFAIHSDAQLKIGFLSYDKVMVAMPEYLAAQEDLNRLRAQYDEEVKRAEDEFSIKYEDFLDNFSNLAVSIRRKRQTELQQLMESNVKFREEAKRLLSQAEADAVLSVRNRLSEVLAGVARDNGYVIILNTDSNACPYIDPSLGEDVTTLVQEALAK